PADSDRRFIPPTAGRSGVLQRRLRRRGETSLAAARSSSHRVRSTPCTPAAGSWTGPAPVIAIPTAPDFSGPAAMSQVSSAVLSVGSVNVRRVGGGFGLPRTAETGRVSY